MMIYTLFQFGRSHFRKSMCISAGESLVLIKPRSYVRYPAWIYVDEKRHCGRVVKATDQKLIGVIPRRFYSCQCRIFCILYCQLLYKPFSHFHKQTVHILTFTHTQKSVTKYLGLTCVHTLYLETGNIFPLYVLQCSFDYLHDTIMGTLFILSSI